MQDAGVHALSNVCHVDIERTSKRRPGEVVCVSVVLPQIQLMEGQSQSCYVWLPSSLVLLISLLTTSIHVP